MENIDTIVKLEIFAYSFKNLTHFQAQVKNIREIITGDRSFYAIFDAILKFATKPSNSKLNNIPVKSLKSNVSATNKYINKVLIYESKIKTYEEFESLVKDGLDRYRANKVKEMIGNLSIKLYEGSYGSARELFDSIGLMLTDNIEEPDPEEILKNAKIYTKELTDSRLSTGYKTMDLDSDGGISKGQLWGFTGRTGKGKTWLACNLAWSIINANEGQSQIIFLSNEMSSNEMIVRFLGVKKRLSERDIEENVTSGLLDDDIMELTSIIKIYDLCYTIEKIESIVKMEVEKNGNWIFFLDHFHNLSSTKRTETESQWYLSHELQRLAQKYRVTFLIMYQIAKSEYKESDTTFKGRADSLEVTNYGFSLKTDDELKEARKLPESMVLLEITPIKIRRGKYDRFYLIQDFSLGGLINEYKI